MDKSRKMHRCVDIMLLDKTGKVLLLQRQDSDELFPNKWCLPGGHVLEGEPLQDAAKRECEEETGIIVEKLIKVGTYDYDNDFVSTLFLADEERGCFDKDKVQLSVTEHQAAKWVPLDLIFSQNLAGDLGAMIKALILNEWDDEE